MISWYAIKEATVSLSPISFNGDSPTPFSKEDDETLRKAINLVYTASGEDIGEDKLNKELTEIVNRGKPYRILDDDNTVGIGVTSHFNHYDRKNKQQYEGQSLSDLAIFPEYQNKGIGREAIKLFVEEMMKDKPKWLHIAHDNRNDRAAHLYTSIGFNHPVPWNGDVTSLHMSRSDAKKKLKEWEKERLQSKAASELSESLKEALSKSSTVYHGSPVKVDKLKGYMTGDWSGEKGSVFVTPYPGIAANFAIDKAKILKKLEKKLKARIKSVNFGYDQWNKPTDQLTDIPKELGVSLNLRGFKPFKGKAKGYLYSIDSDRYDKHMFNKNPNSDVEFLLNGDVDYVKRKPVKIRYTVRPSEEEIARKGLGVLLPKK